MLIFNQYSMATDISFGQVCLHFNRYIFSALPETKYITIENGCYDILIMFFLLFVIIEYLLRLWRLTEITFNLKN